VTSTASAPFAIRRAASDRRAVIGMALGRPGYFSDDVGKRDMDDVTSSRRNLTSPSSNIGRFRSLRSIRLSTLFRNAMADSQLPLLP
jgi:hypothetical protein